MKASKIAMCHYILGLICVLTGFIIQVIFQYKTLEPFILSLAVLCLLWLMGIQIDLYHKEKS